MDFSGSENKYVVFVRANVVPLLLGLGGLMFLGYGLMSLSTQKPNQDILFEGARDEIPLKDSKKTKLTVDVEGAVLRPGIYTLEADSRVHDALIAAGGMSKEADREIVTKTLNMAAKLIDGGKIYIPFFGESQPVTDGQSGSAIGVLGALSNTININTASQKELEALPGIGEVTAQKIIGGRPYGSIDELAQKKIVGKKVFEQIKDKVASY